MLPPITAVEWVVALVYPCVFTFFNVRQYFPRYMELLLFASSQNRAGQSVIALVSSYALFIKTWRVRRLRMYWKRNRNGRRTDVIQVWSEDWQAVVALGLHVMECLQGHIFQLAHNRFLGKVKGEPTAKYWSGIDNEEVKFDTLLTLWRRNFL